MTDCNVRDQLWGKVMSTIQDEKINERMICLGVAIIDCCRQCGDANNGIHNFAAYLHSSDTNFMRFVSNFLKEYMDGSLGKTGQQDLHFQCTQDESEISSVNL